MPIFRLDPIEHKRDELDWRATLITDTCWTRAHDSYEARFNVMGASMRMYERESRTLHNPWGEASLTTCAEDNQGIDVPEGVVVTAGGHTFTVPR